MARRRTIRILGLGEWLEHQNELDPMPPTLDHFGEHLRQRELWRLRRLEGELAESEGIPYAIEFSQQDLAQRGLDAREPARWPVPAVDDLSWLNSLATA